MDDPIDQIELMYLVGFVILFFLLGCNLIVIIMMLVLVCGRLISRRGCVCRLISLVLG